MKNKLKNKILIVVLAFSLFCSIGRGLALAAKNTIVTKELETSITGIALSRASQVALYQNRSGKVTETEEGDEDSFYEIEVTLQNGSQVDVQLDRQFNYISEKTEVVDEKEINAIK